MIDIKKRPEEIERIIGEPSPDGRLDWRPDYYDKTESGVERLYLEREYLIKMLGENKPYKYMKSQEKFQKYGKSSIMIAQESAADAVVLAKSLIEQNKND